MKNIKYTSFLFVIYINILLSASPGDIIITEIFYKKSAGNLPEYVELYNRTSEDINLHGWIMKFGSNMLNIEEVFEPGSVDAFNIRSQKYVALITDGQFKSESGTTFCSANNFHYIYNTCADSSYDFFWRQGGFSGLDDDSDSIIIIDENGLGIDTVIYSQNNNFPIQPDVSGKSIEFIINPDIFMTDSLNDIGENWKLSEQLSDSLWNGTSKDYGSPLSENHINPKIEVKTSYSREILPKEVKLKSATKQVSTFGSFVHSLHTEDYELLGRSLNDYLIEKYRKKLIPLFDEIKGITLNNGALGCSISGSGPSVFALTKGIEKANEINLLVSDLYKTSGYDFSTYVSKISEKGVRTLSI